MKKLITILYGKQIEEYKGLSFKQKLACCYFAASFVLMMMSACSDSTAAMIISLANMAAAILASRKYIPDFGKEDE